MSLIITTPPTVEPLELAEAKAHLRLDSGENEEDDLILSMIGQARSIAEKKIGGAIMAAAYTYSLDCFPREIQLPIGPIFDGNITSITYIDTAGAEQTLDAENYKVSYGRQCRIRPAYGQTWPSTRAEMDAVSILFTAGYGAANDIPPAIKAAIRLILGDLYHRRENSVDGAVHEIPVGAKNLLMPFINIY